MTQDYNRRDLLKVIFGGIISTLSGLLGMTTIGTRLGSVKIKNNSIISMTSLPETGPWPTVDPFLFCQIIILSVLISNLFIMNLR